MNGIKVKGDVNMKENGLLEIIAAHRTMAALDEILQKDKVYQEALAEEQEASDQMEDMDFTEDQKKVVDRVITAYNQCGAAYGAAAYRFGMEDSVRLLKELGEIA